MELKNLTDAAVAFIDNGADGCSYCEGDKDPDSSDNPEKAVISFVNDRQATYNYYISVQNELNKAYSILRNRASQRLYNESFESLKAREKEWPKDDLESPDYEKLDAQIQKVKDLYPIKISEAEPQAQAQ